MLWEQYSPKYLKDIVAPKSLIVMLKSFISNNKTLDKFPNSIFVGPNTHHISRVVRCFLANYFDEKIHILKKIQHYTKNNSTGYNTIIYQSPYHIEIDLNGLKFADRPVMIDIFNNYLATKNISTNSFKILIFHNFNCLTQPAQFSLRRKIEETSGHLKLFLISKSATNIENALLSRCPIIKCPEFKKKELIKTIEKVCVDENIPIDKDLIVKSIELGKYDIKKILIYLDTFRTHRDIEVINPIDKLLIQIKAILNKTTFDKEEVDNIISKLMLSKISPDLILKYILNITIDIINQEKNKYAVVDILSNLEYKISQGAHIMILLEKCLIDLYIIIQQEKNTT